MNRAEEKRLLIEEINSLDNERILDAIRELLAFGKKYQDEDNIGSDSIVRESEQELYKGKISNGKDTIH